MAIYQEFYLFYRGRKFKSLLRNGYFGDEGFTQKTGKHMVLTLADKKKMRILALRQMKRPYPAKIYQAYINTRS